MFRNVGRRLSRAVRNEGEPEEGTQSQGRGSDRLARGIGPDGSVREEEESTPSSASTPRPEPEPEPEPEPDAARARARSRSRSRSRRRTSTISRHPPPPDLSSSGVAGGKRVQWAPKNRIEHFEHVPLEEESDEESRYVDERMRELDEFGANVCLDIHLILYVLLKADPTLLARRACKTSSSFRALFSLPRSRAFSEY